MTENASQTNSGTSMAPPTDEPHFEIHIIDSPRGLQMSAPPNPLLVMQILGKAMMVYVAEAVKSQQSRIVAPKGAMIDPKILENAGMKGA